MAYEKRLCVLKQIKKGFSADGTAFSGAVVAERWGETLTIKPSLIGIAPVKEGRYLLVVQIQEKNFLFDLSQEGSLTVEKSPSLKEGFSALVCFVKGEAEGIAFGSCGQNIPHIEQMLSALKGEEKKKKRPVSQPLPPTQTPSVSAPNLPLAPTPPLSGESAFDDEAIAEENYYEGRTTAHAGTQTTHQEKTGEGEKSTSACANEGDLTYYFEVRERLKKAFERYPRDERLQSVFPQSEWVNTGEGLLGIIYEGGAPSLLCVATFSEPSEKMQDKGCYVPLSPFSEERAYIVFQDARTGESVKIGEN